MENETNKIFGRLVNAHDSLLFTEDTLKKAWSNGIVRMRKQDIERAKMFLKNINALSKDARKYLESFATVAPEKQ